MGGNSGWREWLRDQEQCWQRPDPRAAKDSRFTQVCIEETGATGPGKPERETSLDIGRLRRNIEFRERVRLKHAEGIAADTQTHQSDGAPYADCLEIGCNGHGVPDG